MHATPGSVTIDLIRTDQRIVAPCRARCPVHINVPGYLNAVAEGRFTDALEIVLQRNPLPSVCGRVCLRPCEDGCRRCNLDDPVAIAHLKRAAADFGSYPAPRVARPRPETVAIVGSGPSGLTVAHDLARKGFQVTLYEAKERLGGMLRYGIPRYRLDDRALDRDIEHILSHGIVTRTGVAVGEDLDLRDLRKTHDAVVVTTGLQGSRALPIPGADHARVLAALPFLEAATRGSCVELGERVVVVGGGNVAVDVARTARRLGAGQVSLVCLESETEMPASQHEVKEACDEGVEVRCGWGPREVFGEDRVLGLEVARCVAVFDSAGRFNPAFEESCLERLEADTVIFATGQVAEVGNLGVDLTPRGLIEVDPAGSVTSVPGVYAAGDVVTGPSKIIDAIASGHRVAACVLRDLTGDSSAIDALDEENKELGHVPESMRSRLENRPRVQMERLEPFEAVMTFSEIEQGYTEYEAAREAQRCLRCASGARVSLERCAVCLTCLRVCPHKAPHVVVGGLLDVDTQACHACGACASHCPAQAISIEGHSEEELLRRVHRALSNPGMDTVLEFTCSSTPCTPVIPGEDIRTVSVTCLLRVSEFVAMRALGDGAVRIAFTGCVESTCPYPHARTLVQQRIAGIARSLSQIGAPDALLDLDDPGAEELHLR